MSPPAPPLLTAAVKKQPGFTKSGDFTLRRAILGDREAVLGIAAAGMRQFGLEPDFHGLDADLGRLGEERPDVVAEFVAEVDNGICGSAVLTATTEAIGKLSGLYVSPTFRGQGVGRALLIAAVDAGRTAGLAQLYLETWGKMSTAVRLYESSGWVRGIDLPASSGADRSYWLELARPTPRGAGGAPRSGERGTDGTEKSARQ
jgi:GNAT superfamily N-acetyltransferase